MKILSLRVSLSILLIALLPFKVLHANDAFVSNPSVESAFRSINHDIYLIEETKKYCDTHFPDQVARNAEAYESWELRYNFFLREMDNNYAKWKSGFSEILQQQFPTLDANARKLAYIEVSKDFSDGGADKCFNFKPSLTRPRSNVELNHERAIGLIRNKNFTNFTNDRSNTGASQFCQWEQDLALKTAQLRSEGKDKKAQTEMLKAMKNEKSELDKREKSERLKKYAEIIDEAYEAPSLQALAFSQYRFARCERDKHNFSSVKLKQSLAALDNCQQSSDGFINLGACINKALE